MQTEIRISRRAADRLRAGHLWVYRSDLVEAATALEPGSLLSVLDPAGHPLGSALYSSASEIALRLVDHAPGLTREDYVKEVRARVRAALLRRHVIAPLQGVVRGFSDAGRLVFSEADGLPGIIVDRYADLIIAQLSTQGTAQPDVRAALVEVLRAELAPSGESLTIWERPDARTRKLEQLPPVSEEVLFSNASSGPASLTLLSAGAETSPSGGNLKDHPPTSTVFTLNGLRFGFDAAAGQKTGAFLDQRLNYAAAAEWVRRSGVTGHALDVCTYHGGFALHLARVCTRVTGVDQSRAALEIADRNLAGNPSLAAEVDWIEADAFEFLRALDEASRRAATPGTSAAPAVSRLGVGRSSGSAAALPSGMPSRFAAIVLDPPAFAKSKRAAEGALRGYKELNLRAMRLLEPGGTLITCSCSHHVSLEAFTTVVSEAASDAGRRVQLLETLAAAPDHPEVLTLPETRYLKCLVCRVE